jgi:hypothetical protein
MQNNKPIWFEDKTVANNDTYQTIKHNKVESNTVEINLDNKVKAKIMVVLHVIVMYLCITHKQF